MADSCESERESVGMDPQVLYRNSPNRTVRGSVSVLVHFSPYQGRTSAKHQHKESTGPFASTAGRMIAPHMRNAGTTTLLTMREFPWALIPHRLMQLSEPSLHSSLTRTPVQTFKPDPRNYRTIKLNTLAKKMQKSLH